MARKIKFRMCPFEHLKYKFFPEEKKKRKPICHQLFFKKITEIFSYWRQDKNVRMLRDFDRKSRQVKKGEVISCSCKVGFSVLPLIPDDLEKVSFRSQEPVLGCDVKCIATTCSAMKATGDYIEKIFKEIIITEKTT